jgi:DNA-binding Lrp family transcriptional regulator
LNPVWYNQVMNKGAFEKNCELLLVHISHLNRKGRAKECRATTKYLAKSINKSTRQTYRYLQELEKRGLIERETSGFFRNSKTHRPYKKRIIHPKCQVPENSKEILGIYFSKNIHGRIRNKMTREFVKSFRFKCTNMDNKDLKPGEIITSVRPAPVKKALPGLDTEEFWDAVAAMIDAQKTEPEDIMTKIERVNRMDAEKEAARAQLAAEEAAKFKNLEHYLGGGGMVDYGNGWEPYIDPKYKVNK